MQWFQTVCSRLAVAVTIAFCSAASAHTISLKPAAVSVLTGQSFSLDVVVSELDGTASESGSFISAFDFDIGYDPARFSFTQVSFSDALGQADVGALFSSVLGEGSVRVAGLSLETEADLAARQGEQVKLLTLSFTAKALQNAEIVTSEIAFRALNSLQGGCTEYDGDGICVALQNDSGSGTALLGSLIEVKRRPTAVPAPASALLLGLTLLSLTLSARTSHRSSRPQA